MIIAKDYTKHIYCIEGDWTNDLRKNKSIQPALELLKTNNAIKYIHKHCSTKEELFNRIKISTQKRYTNYSLIYFAFHGESCGIKVGKETISFSDLAEEFKGNLNDKIIHLGSCSTLWDAKREIKYFLESTGAICVSGFEKDVDFISSTVFDVLYFEMYQKYRNVKTIEKYMKTYYKELCKALKFKMIYNS